MPFRSGCVDLVVVGDELLSGRTVDTNSARVGRQLARLGLAPQRVVRVGDSETAICRAVRSAVRGAGVVFVIGGFGPTSDDRTLAAVCRVLGREAVTHRPTLERIRAAFRRRGVAMPDMAARQALVPRGALVISNPVGMVPGMIVRQGSRAVCLLPGVPAELDALLQRGVLPFLRRRPGRRPLHSAVLRTTGVPEALVAAAAEPIVAGFSGVRPAFYPSVSGVDVVILGADRAEVARCRRRVRTELGEAVYASGERSIESVLGERLRRAGLTLAVAESCTGGLVSDRVTNVSGSSGYFLGGVVAYSNRAKQELLGVRPATLRQHGAVSAQTVTEMAAGVRRRFGADVGIAVSGVAGPGGGSRRKPAGLVFVAAGDGRRCAVEERRFIGGRRSIKERSAVAALDLCRRLVAGRA